MKNKYIRFIIISYLIVLVLGTILYYFMPEKKFVKNKSINETIEVKQKDLTIRENISELPKMKLKGESNIESNVFNYEGANLEILCTNSEGNIFMERKGINDNKIEVYIYKTTSSLNGIDITDKIKPAKIEMINNKLNIKYQKQEYSFTEFLKDFTINQFFQEESNKTYKGESGLGNSIIFIRVPKNLTILNDERFNYIN